MSISEPKKVLRHRWLPAKGGVYLKCAKCGALRKRGAVRDFRPCTVAGKTRGGPVILPRAERSRRGLELTMTDEALAALEYLAKRLGVSRSAIVEGLVLAAADEERAQVAGKVFGGK